MPDGGAIRRLGKVKVVGINDPVELFQLLAPDALSADPVGSTDLIECMWPPIGETESQTNQPTAPILSLDMLYSEAPREDFVPIQTPTPSPIGVAPAEP